MRKNNDKMLLEYLVKKYGTNKLTKEINNINESFFNAKSILNVNVNILKDDAMYYGFVNKINDTIFSSNDYKVDNVLNDINDFLINELL